MKNKKIFIGLIFAVIVFTNFAFVSFASAQVSTPEPKWTGLVPCGRNTDDPKTPENESAPCTLCHLVVGFQRLVEYGMYMVVTLALVGIFFAGVMYMVSTGDENMMTQAKGFLKVSLIGFAVVISSWLIVNVTMWVLGAKGSGDTGGVLGIQVSSWNKFTCSTTSSAVTGTTQSVSSSSTSPATTAPTDPVISLSPTSLTFPDTGIGPVSDPQKITVTNTGGGSLKIESVQFTGTNFSDFAQTNTCGGELAKNATCTISITFKPTALGGKSAVINIASNATEKTKTANLSGTARNKQCELLAGSKNASFVFMLMRTQCGTPSGIGDSQPGCKNWNINNANESSQFSDKANRMAKGLDEIPLADKNYFAVYRMDEIYDGSNGSKLQDIIQKDCPEASKNKLFSYGYIYNDNMRAYAGALNTGNAYYGFAGSAVHDIKVFAHEQLGHIFAKFRDEYDSAGNDTFWDTLNASSMLGLPWVNVTRDNKCAKWQSLSNSCFQGCNYTSARCYRASENSIMRNTGDASSIFNSVQKYIIDACVKDFSNCPPSNLTETVIF